MKRMNGPSNVQPWELEARLMYADSLLSDLRDTKSLGGAGWLRQPLISAIQQWRDDAADEISGHQRSTAQRSKENRKRQRDREVRLRRLDEIRISHYISRRRFPTGLIGISRSQFDRWKDGFKADTADQAIDAFLERYDREPDFVRHQIASWQERKENDRDLRREQREDEKRRKIATALTTVLRPVSEER